MFFLPLSLRKTSFHLRNSPRLLRLLSSSPSVFEDGALFPGVDNFGHYSVILPEEPFVFGVSHIKPRMVPNHINRPPYAIRDSSSRKAVQKDAEDVDGKFPLGGEAEGKLRSVASLAKTVREYAGSLVKVCLHYNLSSLYLAQWKTRKVGTTTNAIDAAVHDFIISRGAYPSPLMYNGFPKSCCTR